MNLSNVPKLYLAGALVVLMTLCGLGGFAIHDRIVKTNTEQTSHQVELKNEQIKDARGKAAEAELRAAQAEGARVSAEERYKKALAKIKELGEITPVAPSAISVTSITLDPCEPLRVRYIAEQEGRIACGEALAAADDQIDGLKQANTGLHLTLDLMEQKDVLQDKSLALVTKDRDEQLSRKKAWRTTALGGILAALLLLL
jgi:uncharacterized LabA/DUF88 family protein